TERADGGRDGAAAARADDLRGAREDPVGVEGASADEAEVARIAGGGDGDCELAKAVDGIEAADVAHLAEARDLPAFSKERSAEGRAAQGRKVRDGDEKGSIRDGVERAGAEIGDLALAPDEQEAGGDRDACDGEHNGVAG